MNRIYFATRNEGKVKTVTASLAKHGIEVIHRPLELPEPRSDSLQIIARDKVLFAYRQIQQPCIAIDSGFYIHSLNGFPRTMPNFALQTIGIEGLIKLVEEKPRGCEFKNCLAYADDSLREPRYFESSVKGSISDSPRGTNEDHAWSKLSLIFIPEGRDLTLAEMSPEQYQQWREERREDSFYAPFASWLNEHLSA